MSAVDPVSNDSKSKTPLSFDQELSADTQREKAKQSPKLPPVLSPEEHAQLDMEEAIAEEKAHHWGHILFAVFGFLAITSALALVFIMSIAFTTGDNPTNNIMRFLIDPSLALLLAYTTAISLLLGLVGLGLGEWHHRSR